MAHTVLGKGNACPKCKEPMQRRGHNNPLEIQAHEFWYWDYCRDCRHVQHYSEARFLPDKTIKTVYKPKPIKRGKKRDKSEPVLGMIQPPAGTVFFDQSQSSKPPWEE